MNFGDALLSLKAGGKMARDGWNGKGMYVALSPGFNIGPDQIFSDAIRNEVKVREDRTGSFRPYLMMRTVDEEFVPWVASQSDLLAEDWDHVPFYIEFPE